MLPLDEFIISHISCLERADNLDTETYYGPIMYDNSGNRVQITVRYSPIWNMYEPYVIVYNESKDFVPSDSFSKIVMGVMLPRFTTIMQFNGKPSDETRETCSTVHGAMSYAIATAIFYIKQTQDPMSGFLGLPEGI